VWEVVVGIAIVATVWLVLAELRQKAKTARSELEDLRSELQKARAEKLDDERTRSSVSREYWSIQPDSACDCSPKSTSRATTFRRWLARLRWQWLTCGSGRKMSKVVEGSFPTGIDKTCGPAKSRNAATRTRRTLSACCGLSVRQAPRQSLSRRCLRLKLSPFRSRRALCLR